MYDIIKKTPIAGAERGLKSMTVKEIRAKYNLTQQALSDRFGISLRTVEKWDRGERIPPDYIPRMIEEILAYDAQKKVKGAKK